MLNGHYLRDMSKTWSICLLHVQNIASLSMHTSRTHYSLSQAEVTGTSTVPLQMCLEYFSALAYSYP